MKIHTLKARLYSRQRLRLLPFAAVLCALFIATAPISYAQDDAAVSSAEEERIHEMEKQSEAQDDGDQETEENTEEDTREDAETKDEPYDPFAKPKEPIPPIQFTFEKIPAVLLPDLSNAPMTREAFIASHNFLFVNFSRKKTVFETTDIIAAYRKAITKHKTKLFVEMSKYDLNSDKKITKGELKLSSDSTECYKLHLGMEPCTEKELYQKKREIIQLQFLYDFNKDGIISEDEIRYVTEDERIRIRFKNRRLYKYLRLDQNNDKKITKFELAYVAGSVFDFFDLDGDGEISEEEAEKNMERTMQRKEAEFRRDVAKFKCALHPDDKECKKK